MVAREAPLQHSVFLRTRVFGSLDGLRCLAIVAVVYHHAGGSGAPLVLQRRGFLGVDLFFVISGFLIVTLLLRERDRTGQISLRGFYARRALRIMPLYFAVLLACAVVFGVLLTHGNMAGPVMHDLPHAFTYTSNWVAMASFLSITWSLSAEEQFYLLWPPIQRYVSQPLLVALILIAIGEVIQLGVVDGPLFRYFGLGPAEPAMLRESTFTPILLGVALAHALHARTGFERIGRWLGRRRAPMLVLSALGLALALFPEDLRGVARPALHLLCAMLVASVVVREDHALSRVLGWAPVRRIGVVSYGIYLLHMFVLHGGAALVHRGLPGGLLFPVVLAGSWAAAEASYRLFETRFLELRSAFRGEPRRRPAIE